MQDLHTQFALGNPAILSLDLLNLGQCILSTCQELHLYRLWCCVIFLPQCGQAQRQTHKVTANHPTMQLP